MGIFTEDRGGRGRTGTVQRASWERPEQPVGVEQVTERLRQRCTVNSYRHYRRGKKAITAMITMITVMITIITVTFTVVGQ